MMSEILAAILRANLVGAGAVLAVLILRVPARRIFGPELAYTLWAAPPLAALATLLPARSIDGDAGHAMAEAVSSFAGPGLTLWALGMAATAVGLAIVQLRFLAQARAGRVGPSVVGVIAPRIIMPRLDGTFTAEECALIRAHEREHVIRQDPRASALAATLQAFCWFNPIVHLGARLMRLDQELACDAAVLRRHPRDRCLYAKTLLKTQLSTQPLPFGCYWPPHGTHPLEIRVRLLKDTRRHDGLTGPVLVATALVTAAVAAWSVQPPTPRHILPIYQLWDAQKGHHMSAILITMPARDRAERGGAVRPNADNCRQATETPPILRPTARIAQVLMECPPIYPRYREVA